MQFAYAASTVRGDASSYIIRGHSDNAGKITKACEDLGWTSEPTAANRIVHNPFAERNIQTIIMGAKCALVQSNLHVERFWAEAEAHFTTSLFFFSSSRCDPAKTKSEALIGLRFEGHVFPFGCSCTINWKGALWYIEAIS